MVEQNGNGCSFIVTDDKFYSSLMHSEVLARQALADEEKEHQGERFPREKSTWHIEILEPKVEVPKEQLGFVL